MALSHAFRAHVFSHDGNVEGVVSRGFETRIPTIEQLRPPAIIDSPPTTWRGIIIIIIIIIFVDVALR